MFAGYAIVRRLGSGAMGEVYLAEHPRLPRRDALKVPECFAIGDGRIGRAALARVDVAAGHGEPATPQCAFGDLGGCRRDGDRRAGRCAIPFGRTGFGTTAHRCVRGDDDTNGAYRADRHGGGDRQRWGTQIDMNCTYPAEAGASAPDGDEPPPSWRWWWSAATAMTTDWSLWMAVKGVRATPDGSTSMPIDQIATVEIVSADTGGVLVQRTV